MKNTQNGLLRWIALFKLAKAIMMVVVAIGILKLAHHDSEGALDRLVSKLGIDPGRRYVDLAIGKIINIPPNRLKEIGLASFVYAALFFTEGIGLWLRKRWAEWFTTIITASLIPLEVYEIYRHASVSKVFFFLVNIAIVVYLLFRIRSERNHPQDSSAKSSPA